MKSKSLREAFRDAAIGRQKLIASEAFPDRSVEAAEVEVTRILGDRADRRPTFTLLAEVLTHGNPEPVLDALADLCGVQWERVPVTAERSLATIATHVEQLELGLASVREALDRIEVAALRERKGPIAKVPMRREKRGAA
jgi:hypothetical protein